MSNGQINTIPAKISINEGEGKTFAGPWSWLASDVASADIEVYLGAEDVTGTTTTGSPSINGKTVTYPRVHSLVGGENYRVIFEATDDAGDTHRRVLNIHVVAKKTG